MNWDRYISDQDRAVADAAGYGARGKLGRHTALLVVDVTYAFCGDRPQHVLESIRRWRNSSGEMAWHAIGHIQRLLVAARDGGAPVIYTRGLGAGRSRIAPGRWADKNSRVGEDRDSDHDIVREIAPGADDVVVCKAKPSAFFGTPLLSVLIDLGVDSLVVCGGTTSGCVRATVVDAFSYNLAVAVAAEATFDRIEASHWMSLYDLNLKYAEVVSVGAAADHLAGRALIGG